MQKGIISCDSAHTANCQAQEQEQLFLYRCEPLFIAANGEL